MDMAITLYNFKDKLIYVVVICYISFFLDASMVKDRYVTYDENLIQNTKIIFILFFFVANL